MQPQKYQVVNINFDHDGSLLVDARIRVPVGQFIPEAAYDLKRRALSAENPVYNTDVSITDEGTLVFHTSVKSGVTEDDVKLYNDMIVRTK